MKCVILAGGLGERLRPFTQVLPKPLMPLGEETVIQVQIESLKTAGVAEIFVATNYRSELLEAYLGDGSRFGVPVRISREDVPLGTCGPLSLLRDEFDEPFLVMNGDILTELDLRAFHDHAVRQGSILTIATKTITTPFRFGNVVVDERDRIVDIEEKPEFSLEILAGVYAMRPEVLEHVPDGQYFGMDDLMKKLLSEGETLTRYRVSEYWLDIGQVEDYTKAREEYELRANGTQS